MNKISFECNDNALPKLTGILKQLRLISQDDKRRIVRIGGDEKIFGEGFDEISNIEVNGVPDLSPYTLSIPIRKQKSASDSTPDSSLMVGPGSYRPSTILDSNDNDSDITVENKAIVEEVIQELVDLNIMFTAFDITVLAKTKGTDQRHEILKQAVHNFYSDGDMLSYTRTLIEIDNCTIRPFLYYSSNGDPSDYFLINGVFGHVV